MKYANYYHLDRLNNASFDLVDKHHTYNPTYTNRALRAAFLTYGIELNNPDFNHSRNIEFNLYHDGQDIEIDQTKPNYLIATENPHICPKNLDKSYLKQFTRVFTWNRDLMDLENTTLVMIPNQVLQNSSKMKFLGFSERKIFSCIINANKGLRENISNDLYLERLKVIKWYEKNHPQFFSLFGLGWHKPAPSRRSLGRIKRRIERLASQIYGYKPFPSYIGEVSDKSEIYKNTRFAYCYENVSNLPDYISEKIFDAFFSGCVPIYWGSSTINERIPKGCFIDRRDFENTEQVHKFLLGITEDQYKIYQDNIRSFLGSKKSLLFDTNTYVETITSCILQDINL
jgi:alpha(1,3/1,4) fucosyltransferase